MSNAMFHYMLASHEWRRVIVCYTESIVSPCHSLLFVMNCKQVGGDIRRANLFMQKLVACPYSRVAVVSHWGFINLITKVFAGEAIDLDNAQWVRVIWTPVADSSEVVQTYSN